MATSELKEFSVLQFAESESVISTQRAFRWKFNYYRNDMPEFWHRIEEAIAFATPDLLSEVWGELRFRLNVGRISKDEHDVNNCDKTRLVCLQLVSLFVVVNSLN